VAVVVLKSEHSWNQAEKLCRESWVVVALTPELSLTQFARALAFGCSGVIHADTTESIIADVVERAVQGEVVLPTGAATEFARFFLSQVSIPSAISADEQHLLQRLADGASFVNVADELAWSERTLRRRVQTICVKLGVANRAQAVAKAASIGLIKVNFSRSASTPRDSSQSSHGVG
jgi:DNA-binding NarL/FixJ family response regulator